ncbi:hypothetical protein HDU87_002814 [Geranomyces variabilis]|uniref:Tcp11-domain-containing protein n=1 Tax=Geranomyces variabilis TaxID=109894 RepID=A0AAD5TNA1_9FUNG|nr:hypothetical protein HDU87_002814 [Geranomyces variabilis]
MEQTPAGFYVVDVLPLKQPAGKPFHLDARIRGRSTVPGSTAAARHSAFIEERVHRLRRRTQHIKAARAATRSRDAAASSAKRVRITETLQVAERNRTRILERQVRACADAIAHVKEVAQTQAQRFEAVTAARKAALAERLASSSLRRQQLLTTPRSRLLESQSSDNLHTNDSIVTIQQWWRRSKVDPAIKTFEALRISLDKAIETPFGKLARTMQLPPVIKATARLLNRVQKMVPPSSSSSSATAPLKNPARVFLSAYMLAAHPSELMPNMGPEEQALSGTAQAMLREFEMWIAGFTAGEMYRPTQIFWQVFTGYYESFESWKDSDSRKLVQGMIGHFMELEKLWLSVKDQPLADVEWAPRVTEHQAQIYSKLTKFGDSALQNLEAARVAVQQAYLEQTGDMDVVPPVEAATAGLQTSVQKYPSSTSVPAVRSDSVSPSRRGSRSGTPEATAAAAAATAAAPAPESAPASSPSAPAPIAPAMDNADPQLASMGFGGQLTNHQLAHELVMDPEFKLTPVKHSEFEEQVRNIAKKAFFDSVRQEFEQGIFINHVPTFMAQIRESLLAMVSEKGKFADDIKEVLELSHIRQQLESNAFDTIKCLGYVTSKMLQLCAPIRDQAIRNIAQSTDLADAFQRILAILDDMKLDLANYRLQALRPHLQQQAVEYETAKFDEALAAGRVTLTNTKAWLTSTVSSLASTVAARNPEGVNPAENRVRFENAYNEALLGLIQAPTPIDPNTIAETLRLDAHRLHAMQNEAQAITIVAALVMLSKNAVRELRDDAPACTRLKDTLFILLKDKDTNVANLSTQIVASLNAHKPPAARLTPEQETVIANMVEKTLSFKDPVFNLLSRRIAAAVRGHIEKGVFKRESLQSAGLDSVQAELEKLSFSIARLAKHNKEVYAKHYDAILGAVLQ